MNCEEKKPQIEFEDVENTPFTIERNEDKYYVRLGMYQLTDALESEAEALEDAKRVDWERMMQVMGIMIEQYGKGKEVNNE